MRFFLASAYLIVTLCQIVAWCIWNYGKNYGKHNRNANAYHRNCIVCKSCSKYKSRQRAYVSLEKSQNIKIHAQSHVSKSISLIPRMVESYQVDLEHHHWQFRIRIEWHHHVHQSLPIRPKILQSKCDKMNFQNKLIAKIEYPVWLKTTGHVLIPKM